MTPALTTSITLTEPMRSCVVAPQIIAAARDIEAILEAAKLVDGKVIDETNIKDEVTKLKGLVKSINDARIDPFRPIDKLRDELKEKIDTLILFPIQNKIDKYEKDIRDHNENVRKLEIAAAIKPVNNVSTNGYSHNENNTKIAVKQPIPPAIKVRQKPYVCECIDLSKVPESHKMTVFNQQKADADVRCGLRELSGCRIYRPK